jgi:hypothetical protein
MTLGLFDTVTVTVSISGAELLALEKLSLVSHALAMTLGGAGGREQKTLATALDDLLRQIEIGAGRGALPS